MPRRFSGDPGRIRQILLHLEIPLAHAAEPQIAARDPDALRGLRVLVVDDHEVNRAVLLEQLESWGVRADAVEGGEQGLVALRSAAAAEEAFDLCILDYNMPGMDGESLAKSILADPSIHWSSRPHRTYTRSSRRGHGPHGRAGAGRVADATRPRDQALLGRSGPSGPGSGK